MTSGLWHHGTLLKGNKWISHFYPPVGQEEFLELFTNKIITVNVWGKRYMVLDHIALIVSSEEYLDFYRKLGFKEINRFERSCDTVVFMKCGEVILEIFIDPNHPKRVSRPEAKGLRHVAFTVDSLEEFIKIVECEEIRTDWFGRRFTFTKDPDGQPIELKERGTVN